MELNEQSQFTIPLKNLLALIGATALAVYGYFGLTERVNFLEHQYEMLAIEVEENDTWIDEFTPPKEVMDAVQRLRTIENKVIEHELKFYFILGPKK
tara:strand:- start:650 stop:940 length:291 start_codon:yes stop_codon:yes gene_type:complete